jgi:hypothetical protein
MILLDIRQKDNRTLILWNSNFRFSFKIKRGVKYGKK